MDGLSQGPAPDDPWTGAALIDPEEPQFIAISPPIPWRRARDHPALNNHLLEPHTDPDYRYTRFSGPRDRAPDGYPDAEEARKCPVDQISIAHWWSPEPSNFDQRVLTEIQQVIDDFPEHGFTGVIDLHNEYTPLRDYRRVTVIGRRAVLQRPAVTWSE